MYNLKFFNTVNVILIVWKRWKMIQVQLCLRKYGWGIEGKWKTFHITSWLNMKIVAHHLWMQFNSKRCIYYIAPLIQYNNECMHLVCMNILLQRWLTKHCRCLKWRKKSKCVLSLSVFVLSSIKIYVSSFSITHFPDTTWTF